MIDPSSIQEQSLMVTQEPEQGWGTLHGHTTPPCISSPFKSTKGHNVVNKPKKGG